MKQNLYLLIFLLLLFTVAACSGVTQKPPDGMVLVPAGKFAAGLDPSRGLEECKKYNDSCRRSWFTNEGPVHTALVDAFFMDKYEVTQAEFEKVMGSNPSKFKGANRPVEMVTWNEAKEYCERVGKRLPTEAEWEKAAKGGRDTLYPWGNHMESGKANFCDRNCDESIEEAKRFDDGYKETAPVGSYPPNGYGLYDMAGNVWEWVSDWYGEDYYRNASRNNPQGPSSGEKKVLRGGSWYDTPHGVRSALRGNVDPTHRDNEDGFRCVQ